MVAYAGGSLSAVDGIFFARLASDPLLELTAVIVDQFQKPRKPLLSRILGGMRREGGPWLLFRLTSALHLRARKATLSLFELAHPPREPQDPYESLEQRTGVRVHRVADIHSEQSLSLIRALAPQLGVIVGTRILRDCVIGIPEHGTLNIHKRKVPDYRGGGPVGYWELLAGEPSIGVTIHFATSQVDAGPVLAEATIPIEECDTLESLRIKADIKGAQLYHETLRRFALGHRCPVPQDPGARPAYRSPTALKAWRLERQLRRKAAKRMPFLGARASGPTRLRLLAQYLLVLPLLLFLRARLTRRRQAPLCILFYHLVANRPANHMCLPLEEFVRQVEFLRRYYEIVSLDEAVARLRSGSTDHVAVAITFDDGYRDNAWAVEYLRYFGVPAAFFISVGHVRDGTPFEHDRRRGFQDAMPMLETQVRSLASEGLTVGSHGMYHEDFGTLAPDAADEVLRRSRDLIREISGRAPEHFAFPTGQRWNMTGETFALAQQRYRCVYSAYGGYNLPGRDARHFRRLGNPGDLRTLAMTMDGYTSFRECLTGNAWGLRRDAPPFSGEGQRSQACASQDGGGRVASST